MSKKSISPSHKPPTYSASRKKPSTKRFNPRTSPPQRAQTESGSIRSSHTSTLAPLRQHIHPRRLPRILRRQIRRLRENRNSDKKTSRLRKALEDTQTREQNLNDQLNTALPKPQSAHRDPRRPHQNHRQPNRRAGQNDINPSSIVKLSIILYMPVIFTNKLKVVGTRRGFSVKPSSVGGNSDSSTLIPPNKRHEGDYPPDSRSRAIVGGVSNPDFSILPKSQKSQKSQFRQLFLLPLPPSSAYDIPAYTPFSFAYSPDYPVQIP